MDPNTQDLLIALLGAILGAGVILSWRVSERQLRAPAPPAADLEAAVVPPGVSTVLSALRSSALVLDENDRVLQASAPTYALGIVREGELRVPQLREVVQQVRRDGQIQQVDLDLRRGPGYPTTHITARVAPLSSRLILVLTEDRTRERRVESLRRDFVTNVSHELKTPVGALTLLAEAAEDAADDPEAVTRFARRMQAEARRLNSLVQQIIELSRVQDDAALDQPVRVDLDSVIARAVSAVEVEAKDRDITVAVEGHRGLRVLGNVDQVSLAVSNLVSNAVAYSRDYGRVTVTALPGEAMAEISVSDHGIGIPPRELGRIFERFYRVDPARHRSTGGSGLGLSIVKHVAAAHGGEVSVWSEEGEGSTFTLRLPRITTPNQEETP